MARGLARWWSWSERSSLWGRRCSRIMSIGCVSRACTPRARSPRSIGSTVRSSRCPWATIASTRAAWRRPS
eukprot:475073-Pyramimonas_sp.AAC.1